MNFTEFYLIWLLHLYFWSLGYYDKFDFIKPVVLIFDNFLKSSLLILLSSPPQAGVPIADDGSMVGDLEGGSYGLGQAPKSIKADSSAAVQLKKKERERERKRGSRGAA